MLCGELRFDFISPNHVCSHAHASEFMPAPSNVNIFNARNQWLHTVFKQLYSSVMLSSSGSWPCHHSNSQFGLWAFCSSLG